MTRQQQFARALRTKQTDNEQRLWQQLRGRRFLGIKFRRQQALGPYIVDFVSMEKRLVIELDGGQHSEQTDHDRQRDAWLESQGFRVLRFWNSEVFGQWDGVLEAIRLAVVESEAGCSSPSPPTPLPRGERGVFFPSPLAGEGARRADEGESQSPDPAADFPPYAGRPNPSPARGEGSEQ